MTVNKAPYPTAVTDSHSSLYAEIPLAALNNIQSSCVYHPLHILPPSSLVSSTHVGIAVGAVS